MKTGQLLQTITTDNWVFDIAWAPNGQTLVSSSSKGIIFLWDVKTGRQIWSLEGHTEQVTCISFSCDGHLLASRSYDHTVRLWRTDTWEVVTILPELSSHLRYIELAFHPTELVLATIGEEGVSGGGETGRAAPLNR